MLENFGPEIDTVFRFASAAIGVWALYMAVGEVVLWTRIGDKPEDSSDD